MNDCPRFGKFIGGCNFEARFDSSLPMGIELQGGGPAGIEALKNKTYVRDVCTRCGKTIERAHPSKGITLGLQRP